MYEESSSDNDTQIDADDTSSLSEFDDADNPIAIEQHGRLYKVKLYAGKVEVCEERTISRDTVGRSSYQKLGKENDDLDTFHPMLERATKGFIPERLPYIIVGEDVPKEKLCKLVPGGVRLHAAFVVDTTFLEADFDNGNGSWTWHTNQDESTTLKLMTTLVCPRYNSFRMNQKIPRC